MDLQALIGEVADLLKEVHDLNPLFVAGDFVGGYLGVVFEKEIEQVEEYTINRVLEEFGVPVDAEGGVSEEGITAAICEQVLGGELQFSNLFDKQATKSDIRRIALEYAGEALGFDAGLGVRGLRRSVIQRVLAEVSSEAVQGVGDFVGAAALLPRVLTILAKPKDHESSSIRNFSKKAEKNRERQARYRASHKKVWVQK